MNEQYYSLLVFATTGLVNSKSQALSLLGLNGNPSPIEINKALRDKSKIYHPDKSTGSMEDMQMLNAAKDYLLSLDDKEILNETYEPNIDEMSCQLLLPKNKSL